MSNLLVSVDKCGIDQVISAPNARPRADFLLVWADIAATDRTDSGLYIPDWQPGDKDATKAIVVGVPSSLSHERSLDYPGMDGHRYHYSDLRDLPRLGETVYLRPNTFKPELEYPGYPGVFLIALDRVVAVGASIEDGGPIVPFQGLLLCEEVWGDDVRVRHDGSRERFVLQPIPPIKTETPWPENSEAFKVIVAEVNPLPIPFTLRVLYSGVPLHGQEDVVKPGDVITAHRMLFAYHRVIQDDVMDDTTSEKMMWHAPSIVIEGKDYKVIPRQMVMGKQEIRLVFQSPSEKSAGKSIGLDAKIEWATATGHNSPDPLAPKYFTVDEIGMMQQISPYYSKEEMDRDYMAAMDRMADDISRNATRSRTYGGGWCGYPHIPNPAPCYDA